MSTFTGRWRRRLLAPAEADVGFAARGFTVIDGEGVRHLERVPAAVVRGFRSAIDGSTLGQVAEGAETEPVDLRGFHLEGAAMACCVVDAMDGGSRARTLLAGSARAHVLLGWIGVGFALARLPRPLWSRAVPNLDDLDHQAVMSWLAVDGYAFDLAFFDPGRWLDRQETPRAFAWRGNVEDVPAALDQGFGRALWFVYGADVDWIADAVEAFPARRRPDLWSGVGLAATLAGGADTGDLHRLRRRGDQVELGLGAVFAATAADQAAGDTGTVSPSVRVGIDALLGLEVDAAVAVGASVAPSPGETAPTAYQHWRARIRTALIDGASPTLWCA